MPSMSIVSTCGKQLLMQKHAVHVGAVKDRESALNEMDSESHYVGGDVVARFVSVWNLDKL